jgi:hypothetical protein
VEKKRVLMRKNEIVFTNTLNIPNEFEPKPAAAFVPDWYKNMNSYLMDEKKPLPDSNNPGTLKRCIPVLDAISTGYIITTYVDVFVAQMPNINQETGEDLGTFPYYQWPAFAPLGFHDINQAPTHPKSNGFTYPKWINSWGIKTPKGYSTLFVQPFHRDSVFTILPGVVDTDKYTSAVNFPFVLNDSKFEGMIPAGTPIAQVIPFKRDDWKSKLGEDSDKEEESLVVKKLKTKYFDSYKNQFRVIKTYK